MFDYTEVERIAMNTWRKLRALHGRIGSLHSNWHNKLRDGDTRRIPCSMRSMASELQGGSCSFCMTRHTCIFHVGRTSRQAFRGMVITKSVRTSHALCADYVERAARRGLIVSPCLERRNIQSYRSQRDAHFEMNSLLNLMTSEGERDSLHDV
jgi:hypothetical protein